METVILQTCTQLEAAEIQALLEAENIPVALLGSSESFATSIAGSLPMVDVCVRAEDKARAMEVLGL